MIRTGWHIDASQAAWPDLHVYVFLQSFVFNTRLLSRLAPFPLLHSAGARLAARGVYFLQRQGTKKENSKMPLQTIAILRFKN
jgi:hypothetical protein